MLFFIDLASRRVEIGGVARQAKGLWMSQVARNLSDPEEGFLTGKRYLIHDWDPLFTTEFVEILKNTGVQSVTSTFDDNPCTNGRIAPFPTSGRTPVVWMGANDTGAFRPPADNSRSAFHPTESGAGWLQPCQQQAVPG